ncbi:MAG: DUF86 domain-containing protein [Gammaproteobacteria bacterium]|nr:DUF86 domain-containing protein [Gammaproteobacteria bacterium]
MSKRDYLYEEELRKHRQKMLRVLDSYSIQKKWSENDLLAIQHALQTLIESLIGLARYVTTQKYGLTLHRSREALDELKERGLLDSKWHEEAMKMIGFRNIVVHDYLNVDEEIVCSIVTHKQYQIVKKVAEFLEKCLKVDAK